MSQSKQLSGCTPSYWIPSKVNKQQEFQMMCQQKLDFYWSKQINTPQLCRRRMEVYSRAQTMSRLSDTRTGQMSKYWRRDKTSYDEEQCSRHNVCGCVCQIQALLAFQILMKCRKFNQKQSKWSFFLSYDKYESQLEWMHFKKGVARENS